MRDSIKPMKKVKPSSKATPRPEFLLRSMPHMKPIAATMNTMKPTKGLPPNQLNPIETPTQAPSTVGIIDNANRP